MTIYYNKETGFVQDRYPWDEPHNADSASIEVDEDVYQKTLLTESGFRWAVVNNEVKSIEFNSEENKKLKLLNEIALIDNWFKLYDIQASQYQRAVRLGLSDFDLLINDISYESIEDMDADAIKYAKRIKELRNEMEE